MRISDWSSDVCSSDLNLTSPFWIGTLRHAELRCLIPATAFAYWSGPDGARRQHWFSLPSQPVFAFAGVVRQGEDWPCFAMLTTDANRLVAHYQPQRSEEHTSELQSLMRISYAVFCLKKKTQNKNTKLTHP